jgi:IS30 family transposase
MGKTEHSVLLTVVDRLSRFTLIKKIDRKEATDVNRGLVDLLGSVPKEFVHSLTPDHGREFLSLEEVQDRLGVTICWPDPYLPEQRGTNENTNGLIREYFPKRTDIDDYTEKDVKFFQYQMNRRPRKNIKL